MNNHTSLKGRYSSHTSNNVIPAVEEVRSIFSPEGVACAAAFSPSRRCVVLV